MLHGGFEVLLKQTEKVADAQQREIQTGGGGWGALNDLQSVLKCTKGWEREQRA